MTRVFFFLLLLRCLCWSQEGTQHVSINRMVRTGSISEFATWSDHVTCQGRIKDHELVVPGVRSCISSNWGPAWGDQVGPRALGPDAVWACRVDEPTHEALPWRQLRSRARSRGVNSPVRRSHFSDLRGGYVTIRFASKSQLRTPQQTCICVRYLHEAPI